MSLTILLLSRLAGDEPFAAALQPVTVHDLGKLLLAFTMLWGYVNYSQFLITWSGNVSEETPFYVRRLHGAWQSIAVLLVVFHFALPFALLLSRPLKRNARALAGIAVLMLVMQAIDLFWLVGPDLATHGEGEAPLPDPLDGPRGAPRARRPVARALRAPGARRAAPAGRRARAFGARRRARGGPLAMRQDQGGYERSDADAGGSYRPGSRCWRRWCSPRSRCVPMYRLLAKRESQAQPPPAGAVKTEMSEPVPSFPKLVSSEPQRPRRVPRAARRPC